MPEKPAKYEDYVKELGRRSKMRGLPESANPYIDGSNDADLWSEGWKEAIAQTSEKHGKK